MDTETRLISNRYIKKHNVTICKLSAIKDLPPYKKYKYGQINGKVNLENGWDISNLHSLDIYFTFKQFSYLLIFVMYKGTS